MFSCHPKIFSFRNTYQQVVQHIYCSLNVVLLVCEVELHSSWHQSVHKLLLNCNYIASLPEYLVMGASAQP